MTDNILRFIMKQLLLAAKHDSRNRKVYVYCWDVLYDARTINESLGEW